MTTLPRRAYVVACGSLLLACGPEEGGVPSAETDTNMSAVSAGQEEALGRFAGRWQVRSTNEAGDSLPSFLLVATEEATGWTITFPDREPVPARVIDASGDLAVIETDRYESVLRPGVRVRVLFVQRLSGDRLTGRLLAQYDVAGSAAILRGSTEATRVP